MTSILQDLDFKNYPKPRKGKNELLARAIGQGKGIHKVLDLTCGLAQDAFFMAQLGLNVTALERSNSVYQWIFQQLARAREQYPHWPALQRLQILHADSREYLRTVAREIPDKSEVAIYLDPMFPEKKKSALPRKEMQIFRSLVGEDLDAGELLAEALTFGAARVIVKRPFRSEPLLPGETHRFLGKMVRYDLYSKDH